MVTFSDPKDYLAGSPVRVETSYISFDLAPPLHDSSCCFEPELNNNRKRNLDDIEPTPIGPRTNVKVVKQIPLQDVISFDQCEDILIETFLPIMTVGLEFNKRRAEEPIKIVSKLSNKVCPEFKKRRAEEPIMPESKLSNKGRKLALITPPYFSSMESFSSCDGEDLEEDLPCCSEEEQDCNDTYLAPPDHCWYNKYKELCAFHKQYGHCLVPLRKTANGDNYQSLYQWVKRQRHEHKRKRLGRHSTLTEGREVALNKLDVVWDSHGAMWNEKFGELLAFKATRGHCNVPTECPKNPQLSRWVKCQRRQCKLYHTGKKSNISAARMSQLDEIGFVWNPRNLKF
jgi:hypothetical protein